MKSLNNKGYRTNKPRSEHTRFIGQDEKAASDSNKPDKFISLRTSTAFLHAVDSLAKSLCMNQSQVYWFCILHAINNLTEILATLNTTVIHEMAANLSMLPQDETPKKIRAGEKGIRRAVNLQHSLGLTSLSSTFRFAVHYTHKNIALVLKQGIDNSIRKNPKKAFEELNIKNPRIDNFDAPERGKFIQSLASGNDPQAEYGHNFPGWTKEQIRDLQIEHIQEDAMHYQQGREIEAENAKWHEVSGTSDLQRKFKQFEERFSDYICCAHNSARFGTSLSLNLLDELNSGIIKMRKAVEIELALFGDFRFKEATEIPAKDLPRYRECSAFNRRCWEETFPRPAPNPVIERPNQEAKLLPAHLFESVSSFQ